MNKQEQRAVVDACQGWMEAYNDVAAQRDKLLAALKEIIEETEQDRDDLIDDGRSDGCGESYAERNA